MATTKQHQRSPQDQRTIELLRAGLDKNQKTIEEYQQKFHDLGHELSTAKRQLATAVNAPPLATHPTQTRRVVRTIVTEGEPIWVAGTLLKSLKSGRTRLGDHNSITIVVESDVTTDARVMDVRGLGQFGDEAR